MKKTVVVSLMLAPIVLFYVVGMLIHGNVGIEVFIVVFYMVSCVIGWTLFYFGRFISMKRKYKTGEQILIFIAMWCIINPVTNVFVCIYGYKKGKKAWINYVGDK